MSNDYLRPDPALKKLKTDKPTWAILLGLHYKTGWYRSEDPFPSAHQCGHCGSNKSTTFPLSKQVYIPGDVEGEGFFATKHCAIVHCEKCGGEVEIEWLVKKKQVLTNKTLTYDPEAMKKFKKLTPEQQAKLLELLK